METELVSGEISFLKPRISTRRAITEAVIGAGAIIAFVSFMLWAFGR